ncbi:NAD-dependent epimerase/dehydratase family protein [Lysinibacillus yapensis]|uniref:NAD-dependent epimerase/dehydratase family protein n=1 Tax=Ureibacillus yapensis TaxID=2304605 RepID=A0A396S799_9BACL|nr:NAD(P)H-binding protein [Lysinibacillus yapensis]RHW36735.1 NAD-dependent epimerase/dehydratase family protein [Lysinibacillus yapensis]
MDQSYKIAIIGGTGKAGRHIAFAALENGYQVRMLVRNPEKLALKDDRIEIVKGNVENVEDIRNLLKGCQIVINAFGQPTKEKPIYSSVTEKILEVMADIQIDRYLGVTGGSLTIAGDRKSILNKIGARMFELLYSEMMIDKKKEWHILNRNKNIKWTLIRLPFIVEGKEMGLIKENLVNMPGTKITNRDIAAFMINEIEKPKYIQKAPFISN